MLDTHEQVNLLEDLKEQFSTIGMQWKELRKDTGDFLLQAKEQLGDVLFKALKKWIQSTYNISISEQDVCIRLAKGEVDEELVGLIPASTLKNIDIQNLPDMNQEYTIYSPDVGKPVTKKLRDFSKSERQTNIGNHGIKSLTEVTTSPKPFQTSRASSFRVEGDELVLVVNSLRKEVTIKITKKMKEAIRNAKA